jgi:hypothetical protein
MFCVQRACGRGGKKRIDDSRARPTSSLRLAHFDMEVTMTWCGVEVD